MRTTLANLPPAAPLVLLLATAFNVPAGNSVLTPISDRYGEDADADGVYETLYEESTTRLYADFNYFAPGYRRTALEFDVSSVPTNALVQSAEFSFHAVNFTLYNSEELNGYAANGSVELGDMTNGVPLGVFSVPVATAVGTLEVGPFVQALLQSGQPFAGLRVESAGCGVYSSCGVSFYASGTAQPPTLSIRFAVPPHITGIEATNAVDLEIEFETYGGQTYFLERTLNFGAWTVTQTNIVGTGGLVRVTDSGGQLFDEVYYRVGVEE